MLTFVNCSQKVSVHLQIVKNLNIMWKSNECSFWQLFRCYTMLIGRVMGHPVAKVDF